MRNQVNEYSSQCICSHRTSGRCRKLRYRNPNVAEIMLNLGYVNRFGSGVNTVSTLLEENKSNPAEFLLGDYTTFKVVVRNADIMDSGTDAKEKKPTVIVNATESGTNNDTNGTMRNDTRNDMKILIA